MRRFLILLLLLIVPLVCRGDGWFYGSAAGSSPSALYTAATVILDFENNANDTKGSKNFTGQNTPAYSNTDYKQGSYSADLDDATAQYFSRADDADFDLGTDTDWSMSFWIQFDDVANAGNIYGKDDKNGNGLILSGLYINPGGGYQLYIRSRNAWTAGEVKTATALSNTTWYHVAISHDASATNECTVWISAATFGSLINGTAFNADVEPAANTAAITVGGYDSTHTLDGHLDEFVFWKGTVITATDAENIFNGSWR